jgi:DNA-binding SARP family transcriptional activator
MEFRILGPLEAVADGRTLDLGGPKQRLLLALLLVRADEIVSNDRLIEDLWSEGPPRTAQSALQVHVANLRRALPDGATVLLTRPPGYVIHPGSGLDLRTFEELLDEAEQAWSHGDAESAAQRLRSALDLWRGPSFADLTYEPGLQAAIQRLDELKLGAIERRIEADLALGRHASVVTELESLADENRFREKLHALLMLALYRSGRQADALAAYRAVRTALSDELGIEPSPALRTLERSILDHDSALMLEAPAVAAGGSPARSVLAVLGDDDPGDIVALARLLAESANDELVLVRPVSSGVDLGGETARVAELRGTLLAGGVRARSAAFVSTDAAVDVVRLATRLDVALVLADAVELLSAALPCDAAVLFARSDAADGAVIVPFGGGEHDWAAVELGAWIARAAAAPLRLAGTAADPALGRRDASLALADASLAVQYALGIAAEPLLVERGTDALLEATDEARVLVLGLSERWREEGVGDFRLELARRARPPVLLVRRGLRPGGLAPRESMSRFTWSVGPRVGAAATS